jgi:hypothetical protein
MNLDELFEVQEAGLDYSSGSCIEMPLKPPLKLSDIESKVFECEQKGQKVKITAPKGAPATTDDALKIFIRERPELFTIFIPDWQTRIKAAEWMLLPPIGLLLLGFMAVWALRGFRP